MRVQMIWSSVVPHRFDDVKNTIQGIFHESLRALAFGLEGISELAEENKREEFMVARANSWPVRAMSDETAVDGTSTDYPYLQERPDGSISLEFHHGAGAVSFHPQGNSTRIEFRSFDNGAKPHLMSVVALLKLHIQTMGESVELWGFNGLQLEYLNELNQIGFDVADSPGQVIAMVLLDNLLIEFREIEGQDYFEYMSAEGVDNVVDRSKDILLPDEHVDETPTSIWRFLLRLIGIISLISAILWFFTAPGFEPAIAIMAGVAAIISSFFIKTVQG